ncbi:MAG: PfaD family polyunsaturated fatty acid/polyketide biosynthesis protein [Chloroflexi bacterium]|nr:PfaD family polyunsaturated fatty acid/polyketide biosynthesis protein [Chloroflexota bacterium]
MNGTHTGIRPLRTAASPQLSWQGPAESVSYDEPSAKLQLLQVDQPLFVVQSRNGVGVTSRGQVSSDLSASGQGFELLTSLPNLPIESLGDPSFKAWYGTRYAYYTGAMANGIASENMVISLGKAGFLGSFGAAGLSPARVESAIQCIQSALPDGPYAFNLIHTPSEENLERKLVELYLNYGVDTIEASAFMGLTPAIVLYRVSGLSQNPGGGTEIKHKIIAKLSRKEVATKFMEPAPQKILNQLLEEGSISELQARLAQQIPMADDITVEADSGGHTDNRPLVCLVPTMLALRDEIQEKYLYAQPVRIGAAGGISTPSSALSAFMMGAAYVVTGSANQSCVEAGTSEHTRKLLAQAAMTDVIMAPAADMFEMGVKVQLLKTGTLFPMRAQKLYEIYTRFESIEAIPAEEKDKIEKQIFRYSFDEVWEECIKFFSERDPQQIVKANANPKRKMALIFRWYLGLSSRWSTTGEGGREMDYQIWCGPSMGTFNDWIRNTYLAEINNRKVVDIALHILTGTAYLFRVQSLRLQGFALPASFEQYRPEKPLI